MLEVLIAAILAVTSSFPPIQARDLAGQDRSTADLQGAPAAVVLAIGRGSSADMRPWQQFLDEATGGKLHVIECPVFYKSNMWMRPLVEGVLVRRRPKDRWADVWTTGEGDRLAQALGLKNSEGAVAVILFDSQGRVAEIVRGGLTADSKKAVAEALEKLR